MFSIYRPVDNGIVKVGEKIKYRNVFVEILEISAPMFFNVDGKESYKLKVKKVC